MNPEEFTTKSLETIRNAQNLVQDNHNSELEQVHLLYALISQPDGLINELLTQMNITSKFIDDVNGEIEKLPKISGASSMEVTGHLIQLKLLIVQLESLKTWGMTT